MDRIASDHPKIPGEAKFPVFPQGCGRDSLSGRWPPALQVPESVRLLALPLGLSACAALSIGGLLIARPGLIGLGSIGSLAAALGLAWFWRGRDDGGEAASAPPAAASAAAADFHQQRALDMERGRLLRELEKSQDALSGLHREIDALRESVLRTNAEKAQAIIRQEMEFRKRLEQERGAMREELEQEKRSLQYDLLEREKRFFSEYAAFLQDWKT